MVAPQWSGSRRGFFLFSTKLSILSTSNRRKAPHRTDGNQKNEHKGPVPSSFFQNRKFNRRPVAYTIYLSNISLHRTDQSKIKKNKNYKKPKQQHEA